MLRWVIWPLRWLAWLLLWLPRRLRAPRRGSWVRVRVGPGLVVARRSRRGLARWLPSPSPSATSLSALRELLHEAAADRRVQGVLVEMRPPLGGWGRAWALRRLLLEAREAGLRVVVHLPQGGGLRELLAGGPAERLWVEPEASLLVKGLGLERLYLGRALRRVGVRFERFAEGRFKTAGETLAAERMSEGEREQLAVLLDDLEAELRSALLADGRFREAEALERARARALVHGREAAGGGWADEAVEGTRLAAALGEGRAGAGGRGGDAPRARLVEGRDFVGWRRRVRPPSPRGPVRAGVVRVTGVIAETSAGGRFAGWLRALERAAEDRRIAALLLVVDSPGGGATASDRLRAAVAEVADRKPVVALMQDVAASGGYLAAMGAHHVVAAPTTVTGSIGVVAVQPVLAGLLERLQVGREHMEAGPAAGFLSPWRPPDAEDRHRMEAHLQAHYRGFLRAVARARGRSEEEVHRVAQGRVWSGRSALQHGLVDALGALPEALDALRERASLAPGRQVDLQVLDRDGRVALGGLVGAFGGELGGRVPGLDAWIGGLAPGLDDWLALLREPAAFLALDWVGPLP